ncbi:MAG: DUF3127 domain-containing protein [Bacteroidia bacterium]|jgi:hypothetical protein|nr:DUF3127 domain-containing protein [Bacteroidia bacterium]
MALDITGKILQIMPTTTGTSKAGKDWVKQEFVIETQETYPKKVCISVMGDKTQELKKYVPGNEVKVSLNLESREYNGKWYTNVNAWRIESASANSGSGSSEEPFSADPEPSFTPDGGSTDDLPF